MSGMATIDSFAAAQAGCPIDPDVHFVQLLGRNAPFDGGSVLARDVGTADPGGPSLAKWQSPDGRWFQYFTDIVRPEMFGERGGASTTGPDNSSGLIQMMSFANLYKTPTIEFTNGIFCLDAEMPALTYLSDVKFRRGGAQPPILVKRYTTDSHNGVIRSEQCGLRVSYPQIIGAAGTGGSGLSCRTMQNTPQAGEVYIEGAHVSMGAFGNLSIFLDGDSNKQTSGPGLRSVYVRDCNLFGANLGCWYQTGVHHLFATGVMCQTAGGSSPNAFVSSAADPSFPGDNLNFDGVMAGYVTIDRLTRGVIRAGLISNFTATASVSNVLLYGSPSGARSLSWTGASRIVES